MTSNDNNMSLFKLHENNPDIIKFLLQNKLLNNYKITVDANNNTLLHIIVSKGDYDSLILFHQLLEQEKLLKDIINLQNNDGDTAMHLAIKNGNDKIAHYIAINMKADLSIKNKNNEYIEKQCKSSIENNINGNNKKSNDGDYDGDDGDDDVLINIDTYNNKEVTLEVDKDNNDTKDVLINIGNDNNVLINIGNELHAVDSINNHHMNGDIQKNTEDTEDNEFSDVDNSIIQKIQKLIFAQKQKNITVDNNQDMLSFLRGGSKDLEYDDENMLSDSSTSSFNPMVHSIQADQDGGGKKKIKTRDYGKLIHPEDETSKQACYKKHTDIINEIIKLCGCDEKKARTIKAAFFNQFKPKVNETKSLEKATDEMVKAFKDHKKTICDTVVEQKRKQK